MEEDYSSSSHEGEAHAANPSKVPSHSPALNKSRAVSLAFLASPAAYSSASAYTGEPLLLPCFRSSGCDYCSVVVKKGFAASRIISAAESTTTPAAAGSSP